jgi:hypothetical protein
VQLALGADTGPVWRTVVWLDMGPVWRTVVWPDTEPVWRTMSSSGLLIYGSILSICVHEWAPGSTW